MPDKYAKSEDCVQVHRELNEHMADIRESIGYIRGKVDTLVEAQKEQRKTDGDWWSRLVAIVAIIIAWVKGG